MSDSKRDLTRGATRQEVDAFLDAVHSAPKPLARTGERGRLIFAMDATASREPSWDRACQIQAEMFDAAMQQGGLAVQLVHFGGFHEFNASEWVVDARGLAQRMTRVRCAGGLTQIERVLEHACEESDRRAVNALIYVGDCMEESVDRLCQRAGELGLKNVPVFVFQEGHEPEAERAFKEIARLSRGAWCRFDAGSASELATLLRAVAVYASGGSDALRRLAGREQGLVRQIARQLD